MKSIFITGTDTDVGKHVLVPDWQIIFVKRMLMLEL